MSTFTDSDIRVCNNNQCRRQGIFIYRTNGKKCSVCGGKLRGPRWRQRFDNEAMPFIDSAPDLCDQPKGEGLPAALVDSAKGPIPLPPSNVVAFPAPIADAGTNEGSTNGNGSTKLILPTRDAWRANGGEWDLYNDLLDLNGLVRFINTPMTWVEYDDYLTKNGAGLMTNPDEIKALVARVKADVDARPANPADLAKAAACKCDCDKCAAAIKAGKPQDHCGMYKCPMPSKMSGFHYGQGQSAAPKKPADVFVADSGTDAAPACVVGCPLMAKTKAVIDMPHEMFRTCIYLCNKFSTEWIAYIKGHFDEATKRYTLTEMYFPKQIATGAHVKVDDDAMAKPEEKETMEGTIAAIHSHVGMDAFFSGEDQAHFNHPIELVINRRGELKAAVDATLECGRKTRIDATVYLTGNEHQLAIEADLRAKLTEPPSGGKSYKYGRYNTNYDGYDHSYMTD